MYTKALESLREEVSNFQPEAPRNQSLVPRNKSAQNKDPDPTSFIRNFMATIRGTGQEFRAKSHIGDALAGGDEPSAVQQGMARSNQKRAVASAKAEEEALKATMTTGLVARREASEGYSGGGADVSGLSYTGKKSEWMDAAKAAAKQHNIPEALFLRLVNQESGWKPSITSSAGAIGLAQLMPGTAKDLGVNPFNPQQNLEGGARYLATQYKKFGDWKLALAAYNAGPGAVSKYNGVPPFKETQNYVKAILG